MEIVKGLLACVEGNAMKRYGEGTYVPWPWPTRHCSGRTLGTRDAPSNTQVSPLTEYPINHVTDYPTKLHLHLPLHQLLHQLQSNTWNFSTRFSACSAHTVQLRLSKPANRNCHWSYPQQQHLASSITLLEVSGQLSQQLQPGPSCRYSISVLA